ADDEEGACRQILDAGEPFRSCTGSTLGKRLLLYLLESITRFHQRKSGLCREPGVEPCERAQHILHQCTAPGADLRQHRLFGRPALLPCGIEPDTHQLAEHLTYFGSGDKIALAAKWFTCSVVAMLGVEQALRHIVGNADRAGGRNQTLQLVLECRHGRAGMRSGRPAVTIAQSPASTIGRLSSIPIVSQPPAR